MFPGKCNGVEFLAPRWLFSADPYLKLCRSNQRDCGVFDINSNLPWDFSNHFNYNNFNPFELGLWILTKQGYACSAHSYENKVK
jgi:hypothetical protein